MKTITVELSDGEFAALELDIVDADGWVVNAAKAKAFSVAHQLKQTPEWTNVIASAAIAGLNVHDSDTLVLHGIEQGILIRAADIPPLDIPAPTPPEEELGS